jgi:nuclear transport factor 2 (NTF2) superfamily protein
LSACPHGETNSLGMAENREFNEHGFMMRRYASINDLPIKDSNRKFFWPLGRRPDDHPGLSDSGL